MSAPKTSRSADVPKRETQGHYDAVVAYFEAHPGDVKGCASKFDRSVQWATRAWLHGWPRQGFEAINLVVEKAKFDARAIRYNADIEREKANERAAVDDLVQRERIRTAALRDAAQARAEEASLVQASRRNALALAAVTAQVLHGAVQLSAKIDLALQEMARGAKLDVDAGMRVIRSSAAIVRLGNEAAKMSVQMERLVLGANPTDDETEEDKVEGATKDSLAWIDRASAAARKYQARRERGHSVEESKGRGVAESADRGTEAPDQVH